METRLGRGGEAKRDFEKEVILFPAKRVFVPRKTPQGFSASAFSDWSQ
jgi:hypothetical protein